MLGTFLSVHIFIHRITQTRPTDASSDVTITEDKANPILLIYCKYKVPLIRPRKQTPKMQIMSATQSSQLLYKSSSRANNMALQMPGQVLLSRKPFPLSISSSQAGILTTPHFAKPYLRCIMLVIDVSIHIFDGFKSSVADMAQRRMGV